MLSMFFIMTPIIKCEDDDVAAFEEKGENPMHQIHTNPEDAFIDQMAMGKLLIRDSRGRLIGGSLEGIIAEIIKVPQHPQTHFVKG